MTDPRELFARLTGEFEDMHALAVEGQAASRDHAFLSVLVAEICNGLQRTAATVAEIAEVVRTS